MYLLETRDVQEIMDFNAVVRFRVRVRVVDLAIDQIAQI